MRNRNSRRSPASPSLIQPLEERRLMSAVLPTAAPAAAATPAAYSGTVVGYTPSQIRTAYGFTAPFVYGSKPADGSGQTIAIVDAYNDPNVSSDLHTFDAKFGLSNPALSIVNQTGGSPNSLAQNGGWGQEVSLDVEWAHAIAPGASILLVETNSANLSDLLAGVNYARYVRGVSAINMSWGVSEFAGETGYDSDLTTPSGHNGITFLTGAGDGGSANGVLYPASSPNVLSIGGTTLTASGSGTYQSEVGWSSSGGGVSQYESEPAYQRVAQSTGRRTVPDVAYDANPNTGFAIYDSEVDAGESGWLERAGTSGGVPQWAGLVAIADQGRAIYGGDNLQGGASVLPTLYDTYHTSAYGSTFHDITSGSTSANIHAGPGYDYVTGLGTPYARGIVTALVNTRTFIPLSQSNAAVAANARVAGAAVASAEDLVAGSVALPISLTPQGAAPAAVAAAVASDLSIGSALTPTTAWGGPAAAVDAYGGITAARVAADVAVPFVNGVMAAAPAVAGVTAIAAGVGPADLLASGTAAAPPLSSFTLNLPAMAPAVGRSFAATLAASAQALHPIATAAAAGAAVAVWLSTESARDRRRQAVAVSAAVSPFGDRLIGVGLPRG